MGMEGQKSTRVEEKRKVKAKHRKGLWSPEEDHRLRTYVLLHGHSCWSSVPLNAGLQRNGKSCRLRWINYLRPGLKRGMFSLQEEDTVFTLHRLLGNKWSQIAQHLPGRTDNEIKNHWHSYLKKRVESPIAIKIDSSDHQNKSSLSSSSPSYTSLDHQISPPNYSHHQEMMTSASSMPPLPKLLFAEWLSLDQNISFDVDSNINFPQDYVPNTFLSEMPTYDLQFAHDLLSLDFKFDASLGNGNGNGDYDDDTLFGDYVIANGQYNHIVDRQ